MNNKNNKKWQVSRPIWVVGGREGDIKESCLNASDKYSMDKSEHIIVLEVMLLAAWLCGGVPHGSFRPVVMVDTNLTLDNVLCVPGKLYLYQ